MQCFPIPAILSFLETLIPHKKQWPHFWQSTRNYIIGPLIWNPFMFPKQTKNTRKRIVHNFRSLFNRRKNIKYQPFTTSFSSLRLHTIFSNNSELFLCKFIHPPTGPDRDRRTNERANGYKWDDNDKIKIIFLFGKK
jgi:hypothetical protein